MEYTPLSRFIHHIYQSYTCTSGVLHSPSQPTHLHPNLPSCPGCLAVEMTSVCMYSTISQRRCHLTSLISAVAFVTSLIILASNILK